MNPKRSFRTACGLLMLAGLLARPATAQVRASLGPPDLQPTIRLPGASSIHGPTFIAYGEQLDVTVSIRNNLTPVEHRGFTVLTGQRASVRLDVEVTPGLAVLITDTTHWTASTSTTASYLTNIEAGATLEIQFRIAWDGTCRSLRQFVRVHAYDQGLGVEINEANNQDNYAIVTGTPCIH